MSRLLTDCPVMSTRRLLQWNSLDMLQQGGGGGGILQSLVHNTFYEELDIGIMGGDVLS